MAVLTRGDLASRLHTYCSRYAEEEGFREAFLRLLAVPESFYRTHFNPGHFTASAWVINPNRSRVLLLHHAKLRRWLQPGGHADGTADVPRVALRELAEETGLAGHLVTDHFFDLDIHTIPARKSEPAHHHYDFRFLVIAEDQIPLSSNHESTELRWVALERLEDYQPDASMFRLRAKTHALP